MRSTRVGSRRYCRPVKTASPASATSTTPMSTGTHRGIAAGSGAKSRSWSGVGSVIAFGLRVLIDRRRPLVGHQGLLIVIEALIRLLALAQQLLGTRLVV